MVISVVKRLLCPLKPGHRLKSVVVGVSRMALLGRVLVSVWVIVVLTALMILRGAALSRRVKLWVERLTRQVPVMWFRRGVSVVTLLLPLRFLVT